MRLFDYKTLHYLDGAHEVLCVVPEGKGRLQRVDSGFVRPAHSEGEAPAEQAGRCMVPLHTPSAKFNLSLDSRHQAHASS